MSFFYLFICCRDEKVGSLPFKVKKFTFEYFIILPIIFHALIAIITKAFQGSMRIFSKKLPHPDLVSLSYVVKIL